MKNEWNETRNASKLVTRAFALTQTERYLPALYSNSDHEDTAISYSNSIEEGRVLGHFIGEDCFISNNVFFLVFLSLH